MIARVRYAYIALVVVACAGCGAPAEDPAPFPAPPFSLTDEHARAFSSDALRGKVWIASFLFTSCRTVCPLTTSQTGNVRRRLAVHADDVWFVSFTVDPEHDTPAVLAAYARRMHAEANNWRFLTGSRAALREVITGGFRQAMADAPGDEVDADLLHGTRLALVDRSGSVRGFFDTDGAALEQLVSAAERLLAQPPCSVGPRQNVPGERGICAASASGVRRCAAECLADAVVCGAAGECCRRLCCQLNRLLRRGGRRTSDHRTDGRPCCGGSRSSARA